jgi:hypothetical protein
MQPLAVLLQISNACLFTIKAHSTTASSKSTLLCLEMRALSYWKGICTKTQEGTNILNNRTLIRGDIGKNEHDFSVYHDGGLLPADLSTQMLVLTPYLYSRKGMWGQRKISALELCFVLDIPEALAKSLCTSREMFM